MIDSSSNVFRALKNIVIEPYPFLVMILTPSLTLLVSTK